MSNNLFISKIAKEQGIGRHPVHPESYHIVDAMARDLGATVEDMIKKPDVRNKIDIDRKRISLSMKKGG